MLMPQLSARPWCRRNIQVMSIDEMARSNQEMSIDKMAIGHTQTKNVWSNERNFSYIFRPIYYCSRGFGLMPFSIVHDSNGDVEKSKVRAIDGLLFAVFIILRVFMTIPSVNKLNSPSSDVPYFLVLGGYTLLTLIFTCGALMTVMNMYNRHKIVNILKMFSTIDKEVNKPN